MLNHSRLVVIGAQKGIGSIVVKTGQPALPIIPWRFVKKCECGCISRLLQSFCSIM